MPQKVVNKASGLKTFKNELLLPEGSQILADNVVIDRDNIVESRRGFGLYGEEFGTDGNRADNLLSYKNTLLLSYEDKLAYDDGTGTFTDFAGVYEALETGLRIKSIQSNGNFYFTTSNGIKKISAMTSSDFSDSAGYILDAGVPAGLDGEGTVDTGTAGFMSTESVVLYRILWGYKDVNDNVVLGAPSQTIIVRNLSAVSTGVVDLEFTIPEEIIDDTKYFYQIYRSSITDDSASPGSAVPFDDGQLVIEDFPTSSDFTAGYVSTTDITPEDYRAASAILYTNSTEEGISNANTRPPVAKDVASYRNSIFYANTKTRHQKQIAIISTALLANDDTFIIGDASGDITYTFKATENVASKEVLLATGGSVSQNIDDTARSLVKVINRNSGPVDAQYISGVNDVPGLILLEARELEDVEFYTKVGAGVDGTAFNPQMPTGNTELSTNQENPHYVYFSKANEPEAVPAVNFFPVGSKDSPIKRIAALRDSLFIFKTDGIFRISGTDISNFTLEPVDQSTIITAPDSLAILNNTIYMVSTQGVVSISETGTPVIKSRDIEKRILEPSNFSSFSTATFGLAYESDRAYLLFTPTLSGDTVATQCYRFNVFTNTWVRWDIAKRCGIILKESNGASERIYFGPDDTNQVEQERKDFERTDFADRQYTNAFPNANISGNSAQLTTLNNVAIGDVVYQEQYITVARFNRLLTKLDNDIGLPSTDYNSTLAISAGSALNNALAAVVAKIDAEDTSRTYAAPSGSNVNTTLRDEFNTLVGELNASTQVFYANYSTYTTSVDYESIILTISTSTNVVTLVDEIPFLQGDNVIYKAIKCEVEWAPEHLGDPSLKKQFREATVEFDQFNFTVGNVSFRSDLSDNYEGTDFRAEGNGAFGEGIYGEDTFGGQANQRPFRTYIPRNKQKSRFVTVKFTHLAARESFAVTGYSVTYTGPTTEKAYRN
jgi:hypothetical protein